MALVSKSVIEEPEYRGSGDKSTKTYYKLIIPVILHKAMSLQGFPIRKDSTIKDTSM